MGNENAVGIRDFLKGLVGDFRRVTPRSRSIPLRCISLWGETPHWQSEVGSGYRKFAPRGRSISLRCISLWGWRPTLVV